MGLMRKNHHFDVRELKELAELTGKLNMNKSLAYHIRNAVRDYIIKLKQFGE